MMYSRLLYFLISVVTMTSCCGASAGDDKIDHSGLDSTMIVLDNMMDRRSVRAYKEMPVEKEKLLAVARCGINAPSALNGQPWQIRIVDNKDIIDGVTEAFVKANPKAASEAGFKNAFRNAPAFMAVLSPSDGSGVFDCGLLTENMLLSARALGLGTCVLGSTTRFMNSDENVRPYLERLDIPEGYQLLMIVAIGYPDESPEAKPRNEEVISFVE
ncbi:MAG: nitroreductase [Muribaculaceae bacterium]|nr:nitroreductase [Muribaculaceae bacterium]